MTANKYEICTKWLLKISIEKTTIYVVIGFEPIEGKAAFISNVEQVDNINELEVMK